MSLKQHGKVFVYIGSYTRKSEVGINLYSFDMATGLLTHLEGYSELQHPSFLAIDLQRLKLYAVSETMEYKGIRCGSVASYDIDPVTGGLNFLNQQPTYGGAPCYVSLDRTGKCVLVANYMGGSVCLFPILDNGTIGEQTETIQHSGSSTHPKRQTAPHAHSVLPDPLNKFAIAADLGIDKLLSYEIDLEAPGLVFKNETLLTPGSGPRHFVFHPLNNFVYLINELNSTITVLKYDPENGTFDPIQTVYTLADGYTGDNTCADIHLSQDGKFLYASNRGENTIVVFTVNEIDGSLVFLERVSTGGRTPRNFALSPVGTYLLVANQDSDNVFVYRRDRLSGRLQQIGSITEVCEPAFIQMVIFD